jgi:hypothetical protein
VLRNTARRGEGGGIRNSGSLSIMNSTLSANSAATGGGAVSTVNGSAGVSTASVAVSFSTISANSARSGGGIAGTPTLNASILAGNTAPSGPDCAGAVTSLGDNVDRTARRR